jgi:ATP-binding protein involved in chromosome partitioning
MFGILKKNSEVSWKDHRQALLSAFSKIIVPEFNQDVVSLDLIRNMEMKNGKLIIDLVLPTFALRSERDCALLVKKNAIEQSPQCPNVELNVYADVKPATAKSIFREHVADVKNVILVASNLAVTLSGLGCRVGLLDADVYGPSIPLMFGIPQEAEVQGFSIKGSDETFMMPIEKHGIKLMSIGFLVDTASAMIWRGPMIASASMQMFFNVAWGDLDYLIVDLPPGTGDVQLTISQRVAVAGSVIVSTPQDVALADVVRAKAMFDKVSVPTLGVIENMSYFICDECDKRHEIFTSGGARLAADKLSLPFLTEIPLELSVRQGGDEGKPISAATANKSMAGKAFEELAYKVATQLALAARKPPVHTPLKQTNTMPIKSAKKGLPILS